MSPKSTKTFLCRCIFQTGGAKVTEEELQPVGIHQNVGTENNRVHKPQCLDVESQIPCPHTHNLYRATLDHAGHTHAATCQRTPTAKKGFKRAGVETSASRWGGEEKVNETPFRLFIFVSPDARSGLCFLCASGYTYMEKHLFSFSRNERVNSASTLGAMRWVRRVPESLRAEWRGTCHDMSQQHSDKCVHRHIKCTAGENGDRRWKVGAFFFFFKERKKSSMGGR